MGTRMGGIHLHAYQEQETGWRCVCWRMRAAEGCLKALQSEIAVHSLDETELPTQGTDSTAEL